MTLDFLTVNHCQYCLLKTRYYVSLDKRINIEY